MAKDKYVVNIMTWAILTKLVGLIILRIYLTISSNSPNEDNEMGTRPGDTPAENGQVKSILGISSRYIADIVWTMASALYGFYHLTTPITVSDIIFFMLATSGLALRVWSFRTLGRYFTFGLGVRSNHLLIEDGPYRYLSHPSYTGQLLLSMSVLGWLHFPWIGFLMVYVFSSCITYKRILIEERFLSEHFGQKYQDYIAKRYRLIPGIY